MPIYASKKRSKRAARTKVDEKKLIGLAEDLYSGISMPGGSAFGLRTPSSMTECRMDLHNLACGSDLSL
jgi:hypothetical protein